MCVLVCDNYNKIIIIILITIITITITIINITLGVFVVRH